MFSLLWSVWVRSRGGVGSYYLPDCKRGEFAARGAFRGGSVGLLMAQALQPVALAYRPLSVWFDPSASRSLATAWKARSLVACFTSARDQILMSPRGRFRMSLDTGPIAVIEANTAKNKPHHREMSESLDSALLAYQTPIAFAASRPPWCVEETEPCIVRDANGLRWPMSISRRSRGRLAAQHVSMQRQAEALLYQRLVRFSIRSTGEHQCRTRSKLR